MRNVGIDWSRADWSRSNAELAVAYGVNESTARRARARHCGSPSGGLSSRGATSDPPTLRSVRYETSAVRNGNVDWTRHDTEPASPRCDMLAASGPRPRVAHLPQNYAPQPEWLHRILFIPDTHAPYHDVAAWNTMLLAAQVFRPSIIVHNGDFADCYTVSTHSRHPQRRGQLEGEIAVCRELLDQLDAIPGVQRKIITLGNHEDRLRRYLWDRAPELFGMVSIPSLLQLDERGWEWCDYGDGVWLGKLYCTHDLGKHGKYAAQQALVDGGCNVVIGHLHRMQTVYLGTSTGDKHVASCFGWLARDDVAHDYRNKLVAQREYQHGFGLGYMTPSGDVHLHGVPIVNRRCVVEGVVVEAQRGAA